MSYNHTLKYRTFDQLLVDVKSDFKRYDLEDLIDPQDMIKVTKRVNYDLGLRINMTKEVVLEVEKGRVKLPNDFYTMNFALLCGDFTITEPIPQGTHIEERIIEPQGPQYQQAPPPVDLCDDGEVNTVDPCDPCLQCGNPCCEEECPSCVTSPVSCALNCKGETVQLVHVLKNQTRHYKFMHPIKFIENAQEIDCECPNLYWDSRFTAYIKDGWIYTNFQEGNLYINYQGLLEDDQGNLMVVDHDQINEYYEYALKQRILENLIMNGQNVTQAQMQIIEQRYRAARNYALTIVNTPNFSEMQRVWKMNRKALYGKYYNMFMSWPFVGGYNPFGGSLNNYRWQSK